MVKEPPVHFPLFAERGPGRGLVCWCLASSNYPLSTPPTILDLDNVALENRIIKSHSYG